MARTRRTRPIRRILHERARRLDLPDHLNQASRSRPFRVRALLAWAKKHHLLALFSTVRLHQAQATMDLRHVLEAGSLAAYAIANQDPNLFVTEDKNGLLNSSQKLTGNAYKWLDQNYPQRSASLKEIKDNINASPSWCRASIDAGGRAVAGPPPSRFGPLIPPSSAAD